MQGPPQGPYHQGPMQGPPGNMQGMPPRMGGKKKITKTPFQASSLDPLPSKREVLES